SPPHSRTSALLHFDAGESTMLGENTNRIGNNRRILESVKASELDEREPMNSDKNTLTSRRQFLKAAGSVAAGSTLTAMSAPAVHAQGSSLIQVAFVGCGGRGT